MTNLVSRIKGRLQREYSSLNHICEDSSQSTYLFFDGKLNVPSLASAALKKDKVSLLQDDSQHIISHEFDLLGSNKITVEYGMKCNGFNANNYENNVLCSNINAKNKDSSSNILKNIKGEYEFIDWQLDFKSGYRWKENKHSLQNKIGKAEGADVKVPWELARLEHLPRLALLYSQTTDAHLSLEFQNQVIDFVANNPPRYGVNWMCNMDVAIRASNIIISYWIFKNAKCQFDDAFEDIISSTIYAHGIHISKNLEYIPQHLNNHYFSNICGLAFVATALPSSPLVDSWLAYSVQEFKKEMVHQFDDDGVNFEASTTYHCLSTELAIYTMALLLGNKSEIEHRIKQAKLGMFLWGAKLTKIANLSFSDKIIQRFYGMKNFIESTTKNNEILHQLGDNDSGHFFTPSPEMMEKPLNKLPLAQAVKSLWTNKTKGLEATLIKMLRGDGLLPVMKVNHPKGYTGEDEEFKELQESIKKLPDHQKNIWKYTLKECENSSQFGYTKFGLYGWKNADFYCAVRCGSLGQDGHGGHAHADQLAIELQVEDKAIFADVGSYIYTAAPDIRNQYRATSAHSGPKVRGIKEPANLNSNIFHLPDTFKAECIYWGKLGFIGTHIGYGEKIYRMITISANELTVTDAVFSEKIRPINFVPNPPPFSNGYGQKCAITS